VPDPETLGVVDQVRKSMQKHNRLAMVAGAILGGFVPTASFEIARYEVQANPAMYILVTGALIYSAMSVYDFAKVAFKHPAKALGFVVLLEGVLVFAKSLPLSYAGLALLVAINAIAAGNALALDQRKARAR
jgi:hypothetical protein